MRTKTLLAAAAIIAAGIASSMAQSNVYSLNVVGYVNKTLPNSAFVMLSNPLKSGSNSLSDLLPNPPDGTAVFVWDYTADNLDAQSYSFVSGSWLPSNIIIPDGRGFFVASPSDYTNTFVGEVRQGALTRAIPGGGIFDPLGSLAPIGGSVSNVLVGYAAEDGDTVFPWTTAGGGDLDPVTATYVGTSWTPPTVNIGVGDGFFLVRPGAPTSWVRNFTVQ